MLGGFLGHGEGRAREEGEGPEALRGEDRGRKGSRGFGVGGGGGGGDAEELQHGKFGLLHRGPGRGTRWGRAWLPLRRWPPPIVQDDKVPAEERLVIDWPFFSPLSLAIPIFVLSLIGVFDLVVGNLASFWIYLSVHAVCFC